MDERSEEIKQKLADYKRAQQEINQRRRREMKLFDLRVQFVAHHYLHWLLVISSAILGAIITHRLHDKVLGLAVATCTAILFITILFFISWSVSGLSRQLEEILRRLEEPAKPDPAALPKQDEINSATDNH